MCLNLYITNKILMKRSIVTFSFALILVILTGCNSARTAVSKETLTANPWELSSIGGKAVDPGKYPNGLPDAKFTNDSRVSGHGGCNGYSGSYTLDASGKFSAGQLMSTKMFCQGVAEDEYIKTFTKADMAKIDGKNLVLYHGNDAVLVFVPKATK